MPKPIWIHSVLDEGTSNPNPPLLLQTIIPSSIDPSLQISENFNHCFIIRETLECVLYSICSSEHTSMELNLQMPEPILDSLCAWEGHSNPNQAPNLQTTKQHQIQKRTKPQVQMRARAGKLHHPRVDNSLKMKRKRPRFSSLCASPFAHHLVFLVSLGARTPDFTNAKGSPFAWMISFVDNTATHLFPHQQLSAFSGHFTPVLFLLRYLGIFVCNQSGYHP